MADKLNVALLQMSPAGSDLHANQNKGLAWCRRAAEAGADIVLFPEMWSNGYIPYATAADATKWCNQAIGEDSEFFQSFCALAKELGIAIALTYLRRSDGAPGNAVALIDRRGNVALTYEKVHTCCYEIPEVSCGTGSGFPVAKLDTRVGPVSVGAMICYDREFPESARLLMLAGAELILTPNACSLTEFDSIRIHQYRARAFENMVAVAMTNYPAPQHDGHSIACNPDGSVIVAADEKEGLLIAGIDLNQLRDWRASAYWGDAFRRPGMYAALTNPMVTPPFVRTNMLGADLAARRSGSGLRS